MKYLTSYFGHHQEKNVLFFVGMNSNWVDLFQVLKISHFDNFVFALEDEYHLKNFIRDVKKELKDIEKYNIKFIKKEELNKYQGYTFAFDHFANIGEMAYLTKTYRPKSIVGFFQVNFNLFAIWEGTHEYVDSIHLARYVNEYRNEVLDWEKDKDTDIELSVIFPTYKVANYLDKCIQSIIKWEAPYVEYVFVNDGSPDNSRDVILKWAKKDKRIKLLDKENGGCASAREYGIANTKGRYIGLIDPDDFIEPSMFKQLLSRAMMGTYDIAYSGYNEFYEESKTSKPINDIIGFPYTMGTSDVGLIDDLIAYRRVAIWRGIYRRKLLEDNNIHFHTDLKRFDDLPFKVETLARAKSVVSVEDYLYFYRMGRPGQDVSATNEKLYVHFDIFKYLDEFFKKYRSSKQLDCYYQVKVQTHYWGLSILDKELIPEYLEKASKDLKIENKISEWKKLFKRYYKKEEVDFIIKRIK